MYQYMINPNQFRSFGVKICDDTTDPNREVGFYTEDMFIPLEMDGSVATLTTITQTLEELDTCT